jgi:hypothetical protein
MRLQQFVRNQRKGNQYDYNTPPRRVCESHLLQIERRLGHLIFRESRKKVLFRFNDPVGAQWDYWKVYQGEPFCSYIGAVRRIDISLAVNCSPDPI